MVLFSGLLVGRGWGESEEIDVRGGKVEKRFNVKVGGVVNCYCICKSSEGVGLVA